jgi:WD40 repeat protein
MLLQSRAYAQNMNWEYEANHQDDITTIVFSPDAKYIITGSWDESIIIQKNDSTREIIQQIHKNRGAVKSIAFSRDGYHMLTGGQDGKLNVFEFDGLKSKPVSLDTTYDVNACQINQLLYGPSMRSIYSAGDDGRFIVIDLIRDRIIPIKTTRPISAAAIAIDQMSYFIAHENKTEIQQLDVMGRKIRSFNGHQDQITDIEVSVDRKHLITSSKDKTVRL